MEKIISFIKTNKYLLLALSVLLVYLSPNIFFQEDARFLIHDNLNSNVVWYKNLAESGKMFASNHEIIHNSLGGIPRGCYPSEFNVLHLLYYFFSPLAAYNINIVLMHFLAFFSMYVFTKRYVLKDAEVWVRIFISLVFALLPFWPSGGGAITTQPLLLYALLNIYYNDFIWKNWLIIIVIPLYSVLALTNLFFIPVVLLIFIIHSLFKRKLNLHFIFALALFTLMSIAVEYRLFYMQFIEHFQSHREVSSELGSINLKGVLGISILHFIKGHYHFISSQAPFILISSILALVFSKTKRDKLILFFLLSFIFLISVAYVLPNWSEINKNDFANVFLGAVTLRFYSLFPLLWFIVFLFSISTLLKQGKKIYKYSFISMLSLYCISLFLSLNTKDYYKNNFAENSFYNTFVNSKQEGFSTFQSYYKIQLFNRVKMILPLGNYKVACLGIAPEIAQFNGYHTIDGYYYYFPKSHNKKMQEISLKEINKLGQNFVGSHCGLVSSELTMNRDTLVSLELDFEGMKKMGVEYVFSIKPIISNKMKYKFSEQKNGKGLYLYSLNCD